LGRLLLALLVLLPLAGQLLPFHLQVPVVTRLLPLGLPGLLLVLTHLLDFSLRLGQLAPW
jgi:hypothetical protein